MSDRNFHTTRWSLVLAAGDSASSEAESALAELSQRYWLPIYGYFRRRVNDRHLAEDLTQGFLCKVHQQNLWQRADASKGKLRTYLLASARNYLTSHWQKETAQKRSTDQPELPIDFSAGESRVTLHPADTRTPEKEFERQWALTLLENVLDQLKFEAVQNGKVAQFDVMKQFLAGKSQETSVSAAANELGMSKSSVKTAAHRLRRRYRDLLRSEIAQTVASPEEVDDEIRSLFTALGR